MKTVYANNDDSVRIIMNGVRPNEWTEQIAFVRYGTHVQRMSSSKIVVDKVSLKEGLEILFRQIAVYAAIIF